MPDDCLIETFAFNLVEIHNQHEFQYYNWFVRMLAWPGVIIFANSISACFIVSANELMDPTHTIREVEYPDTIYPPGILDVPTKDAAGRDLPAAFDSLSSHVFQITLGTPSPRSK